MEPTAVFGDPELPRGDGTPIAAALVPFDSAHSALVAASQRLDMERLLKLLRSSQSQEETTVLISTFLTERMHQLSTAAAQAGLHLIQVDEVIAIAPAHHIVLVESITDLASQYLYLAGWLRLLDRTVYPRVRVVRTAVYQGFDGKSYFVRPQGLAVAESVPISANQAEISAVQTKTRTVPTAVGDLELRIASGVRMDRLRRKLSSKVASGAAIVIAAAAPDNPTRMAVVPAASAKKGETSFVTVGDLHRVADSDALLAECARLLKWAGDAQASVLVLPELFLPERLVGDFRSLVRAVDGPDITVVGLGHATSAHRPPLQVNRAIVLDDSGDVLSVHQKTVPFSQLMGGVLVSEFLDAGDHFEVLELGPLNLCVAICVEFFQRRASGLLHQLHTTVYAVPSRSPKLSPHESEAQRHWANNQTRTACSNVWDNPTPTSEVFVRDRDHSRGKSWVSVRL